ncbi:hypothetical protein Pan44_34460 [Caulifigura coniformis]|uniref:Uncharacterized protein n=1 Tax=Caulifigura coniformis TaxID=2527983 RepID=A0A517SH03_9PLAN|nr:hypothetical protein [Caulifigura coniformis]QDT55403.1 hypothetical protein Pan44_34460 [Caulifigura coniformis]
MLLRRALLTAAVFGATALNQSASAQDVPAPPPAGVQSVPRKAVPEQPAQNPPAQAESLPQLPENPIRLQEEKPVPVQPAAPAENEPVEQPAVSSGLDMQAAPPPEAARKPVQPKGPVYYFPLDLRVDPSSVTMPPAMHIPNSPAVEDLSISGDHGRYTYYSYRRPWYTPGHLSANVTIVW